MLSMIVATDKQGCIGKDGKLPWHDKQELKHFSQYTKGKKLIMGVNTFLSLPKILKNREHLVVVNALADVHSFNQKYPYYGVVFMTMGRLRNYIQLNPHHHFVVIGGAKTYRYFEPMVSEIVWSEGKFTVLQGDAWYFPPVMKTDIDGMTQWALIETKELQNFTVRTYRKVSFIKRLYRRFIKPLFNRCPIPAFCKNKS